MEVSHSWPFRNILAISLTSEVKVQLFVPSGRRGVTYENQAEVLANPKKHQCNLITFHNNMNI